MIAPFPAVITSETRERENRPASRRVPQTSDFRYPASVFRVGAQ